MRILTWNCNGALRKKFKYLLDFDADVYIIQECENPVEVKHKEYNEWANNYLWIGDTKNKGIGVFAKKNIELEKLNWSDNFKNHKVKHFLPCSINKEFDLLAIWTHDNNSPTFGYIGQLWKYIQINKEHFKKILFVGDFNSNTVWDKWDRWWNHSDVVNELKEIGIESMYHKFTNEEQGKERQPTFFLHRKPEKPHHIDYIFGSKEFSNKLKELKIGESKKWLEISDHLPMICDFES